MVDDLDEHRLKQLEHPRSNNRLFFSLISLIFIAVLAADSLLSDVSSLINQSLSEQTRIILYSLISALAIISGTVIVRYNIKKIKTELPSKNRVLILLSKIVPYIQYTIIGFLLLIAIQIIFTSQFFAIFLVATLAISWSTGVILMGIMSFKFIQWYRAKKNFLVLLYLVATLMFCATLGSTIIPQLFITVQSSSFYVNSHSTEVKPFQANPQSLSILFAIISIANWLVIPLVFILWAATASMLNHYSKSFGKGKYWIMLCTPLAGFIIGTISLLFFLPSLNSIFDQKVIPYTAMAFGGILMEGFLLAFAFKTISKSIEKRSRSSVNNYLSVSGTGIAIVFVSFFANPSSGSYLPFGVVAASFFALGSYLFFSGIYSSAISISSDVRLRQAIRKSLLDHSKLLDNIGLADFNLEMDKKTEDLLKKHKETMREEIGVESSISEIDMKNYVKEIMVELQKGKNDLSDRS